MAKSLTKLITWKSLSPGPTLAYHVGCIIDGYLYIHGGVCCKHERHPTNHFYRYNIALDTWEDLSSTDSPALSHHVAMVIGNDNMVLIGGWNGSHRVADVYAYNVTTKQWKTFSTTGFSDQAGLSSHTGTFLLDDSILIIGREGSLHMQRRYGNGFLLKIDIKKCTAVYSSVSWSFDSRSGHSADGVGNSLYIIGGRADKFVDVIPIKTKHSSDASLNKYSGKFDDFVKNAIKEMNPMKKVPSCRKAHKTIVFNDGILIFGGETFDGRKRDPVGEVLFFKTKTLEWFNLGDCNIDRAGHVICATNEKVLLHGGEGCKMSIHSEIYELTSLTV